MMKNSIVLSSLLFPFLALAQEAPTPYGVLPSERQLKWHEMELYCLIHFTPTTFQDKEWGFGDADPKIFNPSGFDANQIAKSAAAGGFKGLISVAKHHDGFCLWPTKTTTYSVASSPWQDGKGDMVKEFGKASRANGLAFGVYLSAWDRNDNRYGSAAYTDAYRTQLTELMQNYGELFTSWHDGANGGDGYYGGLNEKRTIDRNTYYEWDQKTWPIVRKYQPNAMIFSDVGPDMRWVGNEKGFAAETSWATITPKGLNGNPATPGSVYEHNLGTGDRNGEKWIPAECDVPQRPGWFYHKNQDSKVKTPNQLFEIYLKSVGRGGGMNLGLAPMPEGYLHANDVKSLTYFGRKIQKTFAQNLTAGAKVKASSRRGNKKEFAVQNILDGDRYSYYAGADEVLNPVLEITLKGEKEFDLIRIRENIKLGQRLDSVRVDIQENGVWKRLASATSIGATRLLKLASPVKATRLRIQLFAPVVPTLSDFGLFKEFDESFFLEESTTAVGKIGRALYTSKNDLLKPALDDNAQTFAVLEGATSELVFELQHAVHAVGYLPRQDNSEGTILKYEVYTSVNGKEWGKIKAGEFSNVRANPTEQMIDLGGRIQSKFIKIVPTEIIGKFVTAAEINFY